MSGQPGATPQLGLAMRFNVNVDGLNIGNWSKVSGLEVKFKLDKLYDHGNYSHEYLLFARGEYANVKLERAMDKTSSAVLREWLAGKLDSWSQPATLPTSIGSSTATITLLDASWTEVSSWTLRNAYPAGWFGPSFDSSASKVAIERLELAHEGFL